MTDEELKNVQSLVVEPIKEQIESLVASVGKTLDRHERRLDDHDVSIRDLRANQSKALAGWSAIIFFLTLAGVTVWAKVKTWTGLGD